ncbi:MAG: 30S ribosomal protein S1 [Desulfuromonas thiophila]|jgi:small subunit ribosomal protein S1|nr:30S ribosomal protein S1 [Desulfuromonas thiophila]
MNDKLFDEREEELDAQDALTDEEMTEGDFAALLEESLSGTGRLEIGQQIEATILQIGQDWVFLDVGQKGEGVLDARELQDDAGVLTAQVGERVAVYFMSRAGGELRFTRRIGSGPAGAAQLEEAWRSGIPVEGRVEKEIKGGYEIALPGSARAFCPFSQIGLRRQDDPAALIGQSFPVKISQFGAQGRNIVVSRRAVLEEERRARREELRKTLKEGQRVMGEVTSIRDFGAFVDIGGIEGLLPIAEVSYGRVENLADLLQVGQQLELVVKSLDWQAERFSFSLRDTLADPWGQVRERFPVGSTHQGKVVRLAPFGAFVQLDEGIDGLVHISRLGAGKRISHPREVLQEGQPLAVAIESIDEAAHRIALVPAEAAAEVAPTSWNERPAATAGAGRSGLGSLGDLLRASQDKKTRGRERRR